MTISAKNTVRRAAFVQFGQCVQTALLYRSALAIFLCTESFVYAGLIAFWFQAAHKKTQPSLYSGLEFIAYFVIVSFHHTIQDHSASRDIGSEIRLGKLSYSIIRPFPYLLSTTIRSTAFTWTRMALLIPLFTTAMALVPGLFQAIHLHQTTATIWQYPCALVLAWSTAIATRIVIGLIAFDMTQIWGPDTMFFAIYFATSGSAFPIELAPHWLQVIAHWSPAFYMTGFPSLVLMGRIPEINFTSIFLDGLIVCFMVISLAWLLWHRGIRKFEAIGI